jgi:hypothetical protein
MIRRWIVVSILICSCGTRTRSDLYPPPVLPIQADPPSRARGDAVAVRARQISDEIAKLRGWDSELEFSIEFVDQHGMVTAILADEATQMSPSVRDTQLDFLKAFGWVPSDFDFDRDGVDRFSRDLLGLYSFAWRRILLRASPNHAAVESSLRHELVHAFQDKYYHIGDKVHWQKDHGDRIAAIHALAEGEAICLTRQLEHPQSGACLGPNNDDPERRLLESGSNTLPRVLQYALLVPYVDGVRYVTRLLQLGGWPAVERAWQGNLNATRDLVHEEEASTAIPPKLEFPEAMADLGRCQERYMDILGEQGLASVLYNYAPFSDARQIASGLAADRVVYWSCIQACAAVWWLRLRGNKGALELARAIGFAPSQAPPRSTAVECRMSSSGAVSVVILGRDILITSVHRCNTGTSPTPSISCQTSHDWLDRLISHLDRAALDRE